MLTVIETARFEKQAAVLWSEEEWLDFTEWISAHPLAGEVIPATRGARKVRWQGKGKGKRGGVRVVYFHLPADGAVLLIDIYAKSQQTNISPNTVKRIVRDD